MKRSRGAAGLDEGQEQRSTAVKLVRGATMDPLACITALQEYEQQLRVKAPNLPSITEQPKMSKVQPSAAHRNIASLVAEIAGSDTGRKQQWRSSQLQQSKPPQPPKATTLKDLKKSRCVSAATSSQRHVSSWDPVAIKLPPVEPDLPAAAAEAAAKALTQERCCSGSPICSPGSSSEHPCDYDQIVQGTGAAAQDLCCPDSPMSSSSSPNSSSSNPSSSSPSSSSGGPTEQRQITPDLVDLTLDTDSDTQPDSESDPGSDSESDLGSGPGSESESDPESGNEIGADTGTEMQTESDEDDVQIVDPPAQHSQPAAAAVAEEDPEVSSCTESESCSSDNSSGNRKPEVDKSETENEAESSAADTGAAAAAAAGVDLAAAAAAADDSVTSEHSATDSDNTETCSNSSSSSSDDDIGGDGEWTLRKPEQHSSRSRSTDQISSRSVARRSTATDSPSPAGLAAAAAAAEIVEQVTPPSCNTSATKQQRQQQQQDQTPVLIEQQRIKAAADCKSPGTPQILLLPCCLIGSSSSSSGRMAAAAAQQQQLERDANGRRVLGEVQLGQIRGLVTPRSKIKIEISKQQQQHKDTSDLQIRESSMTVDATPVKTQNAVGGAAAAAAPGTPEILKFQHTPQQQQFKQQQQQEQEVRLDTRQCKDNKQQQQQQQQQQFMTPKAVTAAAAAATAAGLTPPPQRQPDQVTLAYQVTSTAIAAAAAGDAIAAGETAAARFAVKPLSSSSTSAAAVSQPISSSLLSPRKSPSAVCPKLAPSAAAAAVTPAAAAAARGAAAVPPLSDCRTISYVRTPRPPGMFRPAGITKKAMREAAAQAYQQAATSAYNSGSNPDWTNCSSSSSTPPVSRHATVNAFLAGLDSSSSSSSTTPEGAGNLSAKPTLEQRVQCAYLRMRLTEAAAAGASWAVLDLAGLPVDASDDAVEDCRQKYAAERSVLLKCRSLAQVAAEDKRAAAAFSWIKEVRLAAVAAAQSGAKQGLLKRISPVSSLPQWQLSRSVAAARQQQQRPRVRFSDEVQEYPAAPRAAAEASVGR